MLKKIVKYGNSCALVLDKALLELLNMEEGSVVKIKTDGISLIISPQIALVQESISPTLTVENTLNDALRKTFEQSFDGDSEKARDYQAALKEISDRYATIIKNKMDTAEMRRAIAAVQKHFANDKTNPEYAKQIKQIYQQYVPELEHMHQEINALIKKYIPMGANAANMDLLRTEFTKIHKKYKHLSQAVTTLNEDPEHIHEMMLLAEKYQTNKDETNPKEYFEAYTQLISKKIPEYAIYQKELKKAGARFNKQSKETKAPVLKTNRKKALT
jgi:antitoxin component of MazEF toxin-antitoxin module